MRPALLVSGLLLALVLLIAVACRAAAPTATPTRPAATPTPTTAPATPTATVAVAQPTATATSPAVQPTAPATQAGTPIDTLVAQAKARGEGALNPAVSAYLAKAGVRLQKSPIPTTAPKYGGIATHYTWGKVNSMDPYAEIYMQSYPGLSDNLLMVGVGPAYSPSGVTVLPMQAKSWEYKDNTTLVLTLNKGMKFQNKPPVNGREVTAQDWVWSFEKLRASPTLGGFANRFQPVTSFKALDDYTIEIKTEKPYAFLLTALAMHGFSVWPHEMYDSGKRPASEADVIGSGPWMIERYSPGSELRFKANPDYWAHWSGPKDNMFVADPSKPQLPFMAGMVWLQLEEDTTADAGFRSDKIQLLGWARTVPKPRYESLAKTNPDLTWTILLNPGNRRPTFFRVDEPPFDNIKVRQAFSAAIDNDGMCTGPQVGWCVPSEYVYAAVGEWFLPISEYGEGAKYSGQNLDLAKSLLGEAGYSLNKPLEFDYNVAPTVPWHSAETELAVSNLLAAGFKPKLVSTEFNSLNSLMVGGNWHGALRHFTCSGVDPDDFLRACWYSKAGGRFLHLNDAKLDAMLDAQSVELDKWKRVSQVYEITRYLAVQRYGTIFGGTQVTAFGTQPYVKNAMANWANAAMGLAYAIAWIDKDNPNVGFQPM